MNLFLLIPCSIFLIFAIIAFILVSIYRRKVNRYIHTPFLKDPEDTIFSVCTLADIYWDIGGTNYAIQALQRWGYIPQNRLSLSNLESKVEALQETYREAGENSYNGVISNLKGTVAELWRRDQLKKQMPGIDLAESPYQPGYDLIDDASGYVEQVKATRYPSAVKKSLEKYPDIKHAVTDDVADDFEGDDRVTSLGFPSEKVTNYTENSIEGLADYADDFLGIGLAIYLPTAMWRNYKLVWKGDICWLRATEDIAIEGVAKAGAIVLGGAGGAYGAGKLIDTSDGIDGLEFMGILALPLIGIKLAKMAFKGITDSIKIRHFENARQKLFNELQRLVEKVQMSSAAFYWNLEKPVHELHLEMCQKRAILKESRSLKEIFFPSVEYALKKDCYNRTKKLYLAVDRETNMFKEKFEMALHKKNYFEAASLIYSDKDRLLRGLDLDSYFCKIDEYYKEFLKEYRNLQVHGLIKKE
jgi:hypothetical protein